MALTQTAPKARAGDWIEVQGLPGKPSRGGQVLEVIGGPGHERYRVRWDEQHESVLFPTEGVRVIPHGDVARRTPAPRRG